ncbi:MAG: hypothetical protein JSV49_08840 [Thermoplasmata archaeon]|nr:MAG: hypothetical protein JSV49_08840 [Thermoplasmata archaeon]
MPKSGNITGRNNLKFKNINIHTPSNRSDPPCILCRGTKLLCGKSSCPVVAKLHYKVKTMDMINSNLIDGSSPPSVFIGRSGYPKINIGPMTTPFKGDSSQLDIPELWTTKTITEFIEMRTQLIRGKFSVDIYDVESSNRIVEYTREIALAQDYIDMETEFYKQPRGALTLLSEVQPHGPSGYLKSLNVDNIKIDQKIEKAFYDTDLTAREATIGLYNNSIRVSKLQRAFSVGAFGLKNNRRFVPTRWSITAVDSLLGENLMKYTRTNPLINEFRVFERYHLDNRWIILMMPSQWCYELIEAWYPETTWNPFSSEIQIFGDHEWHKGRSTYAQIGGCYYAARLAVNEYLNNERRQAGVVVLREAHPGYILPVGVWNVRENVRAALRTRPFTFNTLEEALKHISTRFDIPRKRWILNSAILKDKLYQKRIDDFF